MAKGSVEIRELGDIEVDNNYRKILDSRVDGERFNEVGTFSTVDTLHKTLRYRMWVKKLLEYDHKKTGLLAEGGQIKVRDFEKGCLASLLPRDIRVVGEGSGMGSVRERGYVLVNGEFWFENDRKGMQVSDLEKILIAAEGGRKPRYFSSKTFAKVDPDLIGQKLWVGIFAGELDRNPWDREAVVIDPENRTMIAREVVRPLDKANWGL